MAILKGSLRVADLDGFSHMVDPKTDLITIIQQVRLCRMKLGAALNRLEDYKAGSRELEQIREHTDAISDEIQFLINTLQRLMDH